MAKVSDSLKPSAETGSLLDQTLAAAVKDRQMVTSEGKSLDGLIEGSVFREVSTHIDERGSVVELFDPPLAVASGPAGFRHYQSARSLGASINVFVANDVILVEIGA